MATRVDGPQDAAGGDGEDPDDVEDVLQLGLVEDLGVDGIATQVAAMATVPNTQFQDLKQCLSTWASLN